MRSLAALLAVLALSTVGCATVLDWTQEVCDMAVGGSKAGALCDELDRLNATEE